MFTVELARRYAAMGLCVIPLLPRSKKPDGQWRRYQHTHPTDAQFVKWFGPKRNCPIHGVGRAIKAVSTVDEIGVVGANVDETSAVDDDNERVGVGPDQHSGGASSVERCMCRNAAIMLGKISSVIVVDTDTEEAEAWVVANLPPTPMMTQTYHGYHRFYRYPLAAYDSPTMIPSHIRTNIKIRDTAVSPLDPNHTKIGDTSQGQGVTTPCDTSGVLSIEIRRDGHYVVAPGSVHESGWTYVEGGQTNKVDSDAPLLALAGGVDSFMARLWPRDFVILPELPAMYITGVDRNGNRAAGGGGGLQRFALPPAIVKSERHLTIWKLLRSLKARGIHFPEALAFCHHVNEQRCQPVIPRYELELYLRRGWHQRDQPGFTTLTVELESAPRPAWIKTGDRRGTEHLHVGLDALYTWQEPQNTDLDVLEPEETSGLDLLEAEDLTKLDHI